MVGGGLARSGLEIFGELDYDAVLAGATNLSFITASGQMPSGLAVEALRSFSSLVCPQHRSGETSRLKFFDRLSHQHGRSAAAPTTWVCVKPVDLGRPLGISGRPEVRERKDAGVVLGDKQCGVREAFACEHRWPHRASVLDSLGQELG